MALSGWRFSYVSPCCCCQPIVSEELLMWKGHLTFLARQSDFRYLLSLAKKFCYCRCCKRSYLWWCCCCASSCAFVVVGGVVSRAVIVLTVIALLLLPFLLVSLLQLVLAFVPFLLLRLLLTIITFCCCCCCCWLSYLFCFLLMVAEVVEDLVFGGIAIFGVASEVIVFFLRPSKSFIFLPLL